MPFTMKLLFLGPNFVSACPAASILEEFLHHKRAKTWCKLGFTSLSAPIIVGAIENVPSDITRLQFSGLNS